MPEKKYKKDYSKIRNTYCAHLDALGVGGAISACSQDREKQQQLFDQFKNSVAHAAEYINVDSAMPHWDYKIFSDNIFLYFDSGQFASEKKPAQTLEFLIADLACYQMSMTRYNFFIRGGVTKGFVASSEKVVFGSGLLEAYILESHKAIFPRVIFSDSFTKSHAIDRLEEFPEFNAVANFLIKDMDGRVFLNYLFSLNWGLDNARVIRHGKEFSQIKNDLKKHKYLIEKNLKDFSGKRKIKRKYIWAANYHNFYCKNYVEACPREYLIRGNSSRSFKALT